MRYIIKVSLSDIEDPAIWRKMAVPMELTFHELHLMIQAAMGWTNSHLYTFMEKGKSRFFHVVSPFAEDRGMNALFIPAGDVLMDYLEQYTDENMPQEKMIYEYDYGDYWLHEIEIIDFDRSDKFAAELLDGYGACPPEDCGGTGGFEDIKESLRSGRPSVIHGESWVPWLEGCGYKKYNPDVFDVAKGQRKLKRWRDFLKWENED